MKTVVRVRSYMLPPPNFFWQTALLSFIIVIACRCFIILQKQRKLSWTIALGTETLSNYPELSETKEDQVERQYRRLWGTDLACLQRSHTVVERNKQIILSF
ncbi:hypothetical protein B0T24DRAFT_99147 [Lasiosphaeria ovina]|uniref:Uncharacterized protein n=1 Tax=Lasiosphaeria ovina TaxID=92902 RepID=A0AAE0JUW8_9PEZI|nr:hypothetical protein B0T24DRAFT_99147 [Lasiosphaeria ovina]